MKDKEVEKKKPRTLKLTDKVWEDFLGLKSRDDKSWDLFLEELIGHIKYFKGL